MLKKFLICFVILLSLLIGSMSVTADNIPSEYKFYFPIVSRLYRSGMVYVPEGPFTMGCDPEHNGGFQCPTNELPLHIVTLKEFYIDQFEVTNSQYAACEQDGVCPTNTQSTHNDPAYAKHPFLGDLDMAYFFCQWTGKRLPTNEEWEKAARGPETRAYPWGNELPTCELANYQYGAFGEYCVGDTTEVGSYADGASPYGAMDMAGNAWEWTSSFMLDYSSSIDSPPEPLSPWFYETRGGDRWSIPSDLRASNRNSTPAGSYIGFRCAVSAP